VKVDAVDGSRVPWRDIPTPPGSVISGGFAIGPDERSYGFTHLAIVSDLYLVEGLR
jgi:hypothetical protein